MGREKERRREPEHLENSIVFPVDHFSSFYLRNFHKTFWLIIKDEVGGKDGMEWSQRMLKTELALANELQFPIPVFHCSASGTRIQRIKANKTSRVFWILKEKIIIMKISSKLLLAKENIYCTSHHSFRFIHHG